MKWCDAMVYLRNGQKITRPIWEPEHYWEISKDGYERILFRNGTNAKVHLNQTEADDWKIWREPITRRKIEEAMEKFINRTMISPNIIKFGNVRENFIGVGMKLYGMEIRTDESLKDGEFVISYEKKTYKCFWCDEYTSNIVEHTNNMHPGLCPRSYGFIQEDSIC